MNDFNLTNDLRTASSVEGISLLVVSIKYPGPGVSEITKKVVNHPGIYHVGVLVR